MSAAHDVLQAAAAGASPPLVSVVMPVLNVAAYLAEAIGSVTAQTYPHWELLLADDGSTDGSRALAAAAAAADPARVRALAHPGHATRGASATRNLALAHARGAYVAFLDGDDVWHPGKLAEQVALLERTPAAEVLCGSTEYWYGWTGRPEDAARDRIVRPGFPTGTLVPAPELLARMLAGEVPVPCTCSLIARRAAVERAGGFEEAFRVVYTDQAFYTKLFLTATTLVSDTCWDRYRRHAHSSVQTSTRSGMLRTEQLRYLRWTADYLRSHGHYGGALAAAVRLRLLDARHPRLGRAWRLLRRLTR